MKYLKSTLAGFGATVLGTFLYLAYMLFSSSSWSSDGVSFDLRSEGGRLMDPLSIIVTAAFTLAFFWLFRKISQ